MNNLYFLCRHTTWWDRIVVIFSPHFWLKFSPHNSTCRHTTWWDRVVHLAIQQAALASVTSLQIQDLKYLQIFCVTHLCICVCSAYYVYYAPRLTCRGCTLTTATVSVYLCLCVFCVFMSLCLLCICVFVYLCICVCRALDRAAQCTACNVRQQLRPPPV